MIPKVIHYCWFGGNPLPPLAEKCIASWKKYLPDYEIKEWNESNFDVNLYLYVREAYDRHRFAFVTDVVRLYALYNEGGVYMDTDVEVLKPLDSILGYKGVSGFESSTQIPTGLMAAEAGNQLIKECLDDYDGKHFVRKDGSQDLTTNVTRITNICSKYGFVPNGKQQDIKDFTILPADYLCPKSFETGIINVTENTLVIHHFSGSWKTPKDKLKLRIASLLGERLTGILIKLRRHIKIDF